MVITIFEISYKKSQNIYRWIEWIVSSNLPFSFVSNELTRVNTQSTREPINRTTLMKYLDQLGFEIEGILSEILTDCFALAFDGWDNGNNTNYCGVFVTWYDDRDYLNLTETYGTQNFSTSVGAIHALDQ